MKPCGVQLIIPMVPLGRHTRTSSSAVAWWCGANIAPTHDITTSKLLSAKEARLGVGLHPFQLDPAFGGDPTPRVEAPASGRLR